MRNSFSMAYPLGRRRLLPVLALVALFIPSRALGDSCALGIETTPPGAHVFLNGKYLGRSPFWLQFGFPLTVDVVLLKEGHKKWQKKVFIPLDQFVEIEADLQPGDDGSMDSIDFEALAPKLIVNTDPQGALVYVDGELIGETPLEKAALSLPRDIVIEIRKDGYRKWIGNARVPLDIEFPFNINLIPEK